MITLADGYGKIEEKIKPKDVDNPAKGRPEKRKEKKTTTIATEDKNGDYN